LATLIDRDVIGDIDTEGAGGCISWGDTREQQPTHHVEPGQVKVAVAAMASL
jgi:hypothetical protein